MFFPGIPTPINVGRSKSLKLIQEIHKKDGIVGVFCQKDVNENDPGFADLYPVGVVARVINFMKDDAENTTVLLMGINRIHLDVITAQEPYLKGKFSFLSDVFPAKSDKEYKEQLKSIKDSTLRMLSGKMGLPDFVLDSLRKSKDSEYLINLAFSTVDATPEQKQEVIATDEVKERLNKLLSLIDHDIQLLDIKASIRKKTQVDIDQQQREYFLQQEMKNIQEALGGNIHDIEIKDIKEKAAKLNFTPEQRKVFENELQKLLRKKSAACVPAIAKSKS
ncbi:hypothetical protein FACS18947_7200 [Bacteroidia bacterium]|nr:hypothetical protein FACS18947_7200 [Bacteroidia bacterium]